MIGGIIGGVLGAGSQIYGANLAYKGQKQANKTNIQLAREARTHDVDMWNKQNEYNTPAMQMQRMSEAGLNPNLMYGQGNVGNAGTPQKAPVPQVENELASMAQMSLAPAISMYQDWRVKNAQIDNLKANADATRQNATLSALRQITQNLTNQKMSTQLPWINIHEQNKANISLSKSQQENTKAQYLYNTLSDMTKQVMLRNNLLEQQTKSHQLENEFNEDLKPYGIRSTDPLWMRLLMHVIPKNTLNNLSKSLTNTFK